MAPVGKEERLVATVLMGSNRRNIDDAEAQIIAQETLHRCSSNARELRYLDLCNIVFKELFLGRLGEALVHNTYLQELHLNNCQLDDESARKLARSLSKRSELGTQTLKVLSLDSNQIGSRGAALLAKSLAAGSRYTRSFGGYRVTSFGPGKGLQMLSMRGNLVAAVGAKAFSEVLVDTDDSLEVLDLADNKICDWGAGWFALAIRNNNVLQCLDLRGNPMGADGVEELKVACSSAQASLILSEEGSEQMHGTAEVRGQRLAVVYATSIPKPAMDEGEYEEAQAATENALEIVQPLSSGFRRPGSAAGRRALGRQRQNVTLGIDEPGGAASTFASSTGRSFSVTKRMDLSMQARDRSLGSQQFPKRLKNNASRLKDHRGRWPAATRPSSASAVGRGRRRPASAILRAPPPLAPSTYAGHYVPCANQRKMLPTSLRARPGERTMGEDEKETATVIEPASRFCFKEFTPAAARGGGASAVRGLRRNMSGNGPTSAVDVQIEKTAAPTYEYESDEASEPPYDEY